NITNNLLRKFETDLQVKITGYKILKTGEVRDRIEVSVTKEGYTIGSGKFQRHSGGEKMRIDLAGILAIRQLINNSCEHGKGINFIALDESVQALDKSGQVEALRILGRTGITSIIVMHQIA